MAEVKIPVAIALQTAIGQLTVHEQRKVLTYVRAIITARTARRKPRRLRTLLDLAGTISAEDCRAMKAAIDEGRKIEPEAWV